VACDGVEALERLQLHPAQLVVTDLRMPRMDGMELLRKLMAQNPAPRVVVITAHGSERQAVDAIKAGALDYFRKPFEADELVAVIKRATERRAWRWKTSGCAASWRFRALWFSRLRP